MMKGAILLVLLSMAACAQQQLTPAESDLLAKFRAGTHELLAKDEVARLRDVGRYQVLPLGGRAWRLDTASGETCLLLANDEDWKNEKVAAQQCQER